MSNDWSDLNAAKNKRSRRTKNNRCTRILKPATATKLTTTVGEEEDKQEDSNGSNPKSKCIRNSIYLLQGLDTLKIRNKQCL
jgi:hypothetical protein